MELLICEDYHFYPNGIYTTISKWNSNLMIFDNDIEEMSTAIRLFGTQEQVDRALDEYVNRTELNLDECYDFKEFEKDSHFYNEENNKQIGEKLSEYKDRWNQNNNKALIINI